MSENREQKRTILPIVAYGDPILRKEAEDIESDYPNLDILIENMFETMYQADGIGLAAPQIGKSIRLFIVDCSPFAEDEEEDNSHLADFKKVFINATILEEEGKAWEFREGCLSIPNIRDDVSRKERIKIEYLDENFEEHVEEFDGYAARVIQHEYDHVDGVLFTDHLTPLKRRLLKRKLSDISKGNVDTPYKMKFPNQKKGR